MPHTMMVPYEDFDGISMLCDATALQRRYRDHCMEGAEDIFAGSVAADVDTTLLSLANAHEAVSWGMHQPAGGPIMAVVSLAPFGPDVLADNGILSTVRAGWLRVEGPLTLTGWHAFVIGADYQRGVLDGTALLVPSGFYEVIVHRPFTADDDGAAPPSTVLIELQASEVASATALAAVPGADGFF